MTDTLPAPVTLTVLYPPAPPECPAGHIPSAIMFRVGSRLGRYSGRRYTFDQAVRDWFASRLELYADVEHFNPTDKSSTQYRSEFSPETGVWSAWGDL